METKSQTIAVSVEPTLYALAALEAQTHSKPLSTYVRGLIVWDLVKSGRLDRDKLASFVSGDSVKVIADILDAVRLNNHVEKAAAAAD